MIKLPSFFGCGQSQVTQRPEYVKHSIKRLTDICGCLEDKSYLRDIEVIKQYLVNLEQQESKSIEIYCSGMS